MRRTDEAEETKKTYLSQLSVLCKEQNVTPNALLTRYNNLIQNHVDRYLDDKSPASFNILIAAVRALLVANDIKPKVKVRKPPTEHMKFDRIPTLEEMQSPLEHYSPKMKAMFLFLSSTAWESDRSLGGRWRPTRNRVEVHILYHTMYSRA